MNLLTSLPVRHSQDARRIDFDGTILVAHQPECLPWLGNICKASMGDIYFILDSVQYVKEHWQNKNKIRIKGGVGYQWLTIPVLNVNKHLLLSKDVKIADGIWKKKHLKALELAYSKAAYFEEIFNDLVKIYSDDYEFLVDFLMKFILYAFKKFSIDVPVYRTSELISQGHIIDGKKSDLIINMCKVANAEMFVFGQDGRVYIEKEVFAKNNINFVFQDYKHPVYNQIQGDFLSHMSFIDLLFNYGPESAKILGKSNYLEV